MMQPESRTQPSRSQRTSNAILTAATALFATGDLQRITVDQIARAADVAVGSIYVHFGSKERLYLEAVRRSLEVCLSYTGRRPSWPSPVARMRATGEAFVEFALAHPDEFRLVADRSPQRTGNPEFAELEDEIAELVQRDIFRLAADAQAAMDAGEIRAMPVQQVVSYFWVLWVGMINLTRREDPFRLSVEQLRPMLAEAADTLERGLAPDDAPGLRPSRVRAA